MNSTKSGVVVVFLDENSDVIDLERLEFFRGEKRQERTPSVRRRSFHVMIFPDFFTENGVDKNLFTLDIDDKSNIKPFEE